MTRALLDTDILSELMKGKDLRVAERGRAYLAANGRYTITAVTAMEIAYGFRRVGRIDRLERFEAFLQAHEVLPFDGEAALLAGKIDADLEARGRPVDLGDVMIAAIALRHALLVVTGNVAHYDAIKATGLSLGIENWREG
ncbi:MAG: PIN domain-containing protein [Polyangiaceae bacterium]|jgi:tRNA(fMet)-specific endonuclease VapC